MQVNVTIITNQRIKFQTLAAQLFYLCNVFENEMLCNRNFVTLRRR